MDFTVRVSGIPATSTRSANQISLKIRQVPGVLIRADSMVALRSHRATEPSIWTTSRGSASGLVPLTVHQESKTDPTVSFINRPLQTAYRRNGVHELVLGPKLWVEDLGLAHISTETDFYVVDLETS